MKIIDAHFHIFPDSPNGPACREEEILADWARLGIVAGVKMSNRSLEPELHRHDPAIRYCIGLDSGVRRSGHSPERTWELVEENLRLPQCVGIKLYPGYNYEYISEEIYRGCYELARTYGKPVAIHMGQTAMAGAKLKYSHPLTLDEVAADWPDVQFVMCHFGNPFLPDAAAVVEKNDNVCADLSGLLVGRTDLDRYLAEKSGYVEALRGWLEYVDNWDKFLFGTDYPGVETENYVEFIRRLVPEAHHEKVFFHNANRVYNLGL